MTSALLTPTIAAAITLTMTISMTTAMIGCAPSRADAAISAETIVGEVRVRPIKHGSLVLFRKKTAIYVDPVGPAYLYKGLPAPNLIVITHPHPDHLDPERLKALSVGKNPGLRIILPETIRTRVQKQTGLPSSVFQGMQNGARMRLAGIAVEAVAMYNLDPKRYRHKKGDWNGYVLGMGDARIYISGDTEDIPEMRGLRDITAAFVCMNLPYTMDVRAAASAVLQFKPKIVYPYHYRGRGPGGTQDPAKFKQLVNAKNPGIDVRVRDWYGKKP